MEEKSTEIGQLNYTISVGESALEFVAGLQSTIDDYSNKIDNIMLKLLNNNQKIIDVGDDRMKTIIEEIDKLQKQLTNTKSN